MNKAENQHDDHSEWLKGFDQPDKKWLETMDGPSPIYTSAQVPPDAPPKSIARWATADARGWTDRTEFDPDALSRILSKMQQNKVYDEVVRHGFPNLARIADQHSQVCTAARIMEKALGGMPESYRLDAIAKMVEAIHTGRLKLPQARTNAPFKPPSPGCAPDQERTR